MRRRRYQPMTEQQHRETGRTLFEARQRVTAVIHRTLNRRVPAPVLDAALKLDRQLFALSIRLCDSLGNAGDPLYPLDPPPDNTTVPYGSPKRLTPDEHYAVGLELYRLRRWLINIAVLVTGTTSKSSPEHRASRWPCKAIDRLRHLLDELFYSDHPSRFSTKAYYPGDLAYQDMSPSPYMPVVNPKEVQHAN